MKFLSLCYIAVMGSLLSPFIAAQAETAEKIVPYALEQVQLSYAPLVKQVTPAVVNIYTKRVIKTRTSSPFANDPFFQRFFGDRFGQRSRERIERSLGSGVIVKADGVLVTNYHVVDGADEIIVALADRREYAAEIILIDEKSDLAVLRIDTNGKRLPALVFSDSDEAEVGDLVLAIGNPFGVGQTVTSGIISALARTQVNDQDYQFFIQTDAAVNPGNSGGALVNMKGALVGINTAIFSRSGGSNGIGFAIPANMVHAVVSSALAGGKLVRPWFGGNGQVVTADIAESLGLDRPGGILVDDIYPDGPAAQAGLLPGDVILAVDGKAVTSPQALRYYIGLKSIGGSLPLDILRGDQKRTLNIALKAAPEDPPRNITTVTDNPVFRGLELANLSPAYAEEIGINIYEKGVIVLEAPRTVMRRTSLRRGDIFKTVNGQNITRIADITKTLAKDPYNIDFRVNRGGRQVECFIRAQSRSYCQ